MQAQAQRFLEGLKVLTQLTGHRKEFEADVDNVEMKLKELELAVEGDVKTNNVLMLQEILNKVNEKLNRVNFINTLIQPTILINF